MGDQSVQLHVGNQAGIIFRPVSQGKEQAADAFGDFPGHQPSEVLHRGGIHIETAPEVVEHPLEGERPLCEKASGRPEMPVDFRNSGNKCNYKIYHILIYGSIPW